MAELFPPASVRFVLVEPRGSGNLGSTARALKNLGFFRLVFVRPSADPASKEARMMAVDAADLLAGAKRVETLDEACRGATVVVGLTARTGKQRSPHQRLDELVTTLCELPAGAEVAMMFGREDRGLTDLELDACTHLAFLPSSPAYPSFNVAQAVLLVAYELRMASLGEATASTGPREAVADHAARVGHRAAHRPTSPTWPQVSQRAVSPRLAHSSTASTGIGSQRIQSQVSLPL